MIERKKINDMKKKPVGTVSVRTGFSGDKTQKPLTPVTKITKKVDVPLVKQSQVSYDTNQIKKSVSFWLWVKRVGITVILLGVLYLGSLLVYHGTIHVNLKSQTGTISEVFTAVPKESFTGGEKKIPYYTYISDISISEETQLLSPEIFTRIRSALPTDAIVSSEFLFINSSQVGGQVIGIVFFKKQDIQNYIHSYLLTRDYDNVLRNLKNVSITSHIPVTSQSSGGAISIKLQVDFFAEGNKQLQILPEMVAGQDAFSCHETLQKIHEINIDKCDVFPFWYKKMPQNPNFIRIIVK